MEQINGRPAQERTKREDRDSKSINTFVDPALLNKALTKVLEIVDVILKAYILENCQLISALQNLETILNSDSFLRS